VEPAGGGGGGRCVDPARYMILRHLRDNGRM